MAGGIAAASNVPFARQCSPALLATAVVASMIAQIRSIFDEAHSRSSDRGAPVTLRGAVYYYPTRPPTRTRGGQLLHAMVVDPILISRPIVVTPEGVRLCRRSETASISCAATAGRVRQGGRRERHRRA